MSFMTLPIRAPWGHLPYLPNLRSARVVWQNRFSAPSCEVTTPNEVPDCKKKTGTVYARRLPPSDNRQRRRNNTLRSRHHIHSLGDAFR